MILRRPLVILVLLLSALVVLGPPTAGAFHAAHRGRHKHARETAVLASMGAEPSPSIFGIDTSIFDASYSSYIRDIPVARRMGSRWDRFTLGAATGAGRWGAVDHEVEQARRHGMGVILTFGGVGSACSLRPRPADIHACPPTSANDLRAYQAYVRRVLLRYRNVVDYYESWAEPNNRSSFFPGPNAGRYAAILAAQYAAFQSVDRQFGLQLKLLFGSPSDFSVIPGSRGFVAVLPFTHKVLRDLHGNRAFDGIALHAYRFPPQPYGPAAKAYDYVGGAGGPFRGCDSYPWCQMTWPQELRAYEAEFEEQGYGQQPLWLTEFGWPGSSDGTGGYYPSEAVQARDLREAYEDLLDLPFVQGALWFNVRDYDPSDGSPDPAFFYHYGLLQYGFTPKPAAAVFEALARANLGR